MFCHGPISAAAITAATPLINAAIRQTVLKRLCRKLQVNRAKKMSSNCEYSKRNWLVDPDGNRVNTKVCTASYLQRSVCCITHKHISAYC